MLEENAGPAPEPDVQLPEWPQHELLAHERELLGFYVTGHPLTPLAPILNAYALHKSNQLSELKSRDMTRLGGLVTEITKGISKKSSKPYALATIEDMEGSVQVLCLNENYEKFISSFSPTKPFSSPAKSNLSEDKPKIFPVGHQPPRRRPAPPHPASPSPPPNGAPCCRRPRIRPRHPRRPSRQMPALPLLQMARRRRRLYRGHDRFFVRPSAALQRALDDRFGEESYYAKVDTTLPQRAPPPMGKTLPQRHSDDNQPPLDCGGVPPLSSPQKTPLTPHYGTC